MGQGRSKLEPTGEQAGVSWSKLGSELERTGERAGANWGASWEQAGVSQVNRMLY